MQTRQRIRAQRERNHDEALDALIAKKREIDAMLQRLTELSAGHFRADPDEVDWAMSGR